MSTQDTLLDAAFRALARKPTATLADVAEEAGVGRATLHRHFKGRDDLMEALALRAVAEIDQVVDRATIASPSYTAGLKDSLEPMIALANRMAFLATEPLERFPKVAKEYDRQRAELAEAIEAAKAEGGFDPNLPTEWITATYDALTFMGWELVHDQHATPRQAADLVWRTLQSGLKGAAT